MKQVNVLMDEELLEHLEKLSQMVSLLVGKKITVSDVVRKSVADYSKYGRVVIDTKITEGQVNIDVKPTNWEQVAIDGILPNDDLMRKLCAEDW